MEDWREELLNTVESTHGCCFVKTEFKSSKDNDHEHCSICFEKISDIESGQFEKVGFYCKETNDWLCLSCFKDFKERFEWKETK